MSLFNSDHNKENEAQMELWRETRSKLDIGNHVSFMTKDKGEITGVIDSFHNWFTADVISTDGVKWGVNIMLINKLDGI